MVYSEFLEKSKLNVENKPTPKKQLFELNSYLHKKNELSKDQTKTIDFLIGQLIAGDSLPVSLVESENFIKLLKHLNPSYKIMSRKTLTTSIIPTISDDLKSKLKADLEKCESINITSDIWSDGSMRSYIGFCVTGFNNNWELCKGMLGCINVTGSHTSDLIYKEFIEILEEFNITRKLFKVVTDGGANMKKAFQQVFENFTVFSPDLEEEMEAELNRYLDDCNTGHNSCYDETAHEEIDEDDTPLSVLKAKANLEADLDKISNLDYSVERLGCAAHELQLAVKVVLKDENLSQLIDRVAGFVNKVRSSNLYMDKLREVGIIVMKQNQTRWNSTYIMINSILKLEKRNMMLW